MCEIDKQCKVIYKKKKTKYVLEVHHIERWSMDEDQQITDIALNVLHIFYTIGSCFPCNLEYYSIKSFQGRREPLEMINVVWATENVDEVLLSLNLCD